MMGKWFADNAVIRGDIRFGEDCSVFFHTVIRSEYEPFVIGSRTNIQDNCTVHGDPGFPVSIGSDVTIGHNCIIHGCTIGDCTLIGMGSIIMNGAVIGRNCIIGAGSLVTEHTVIPDDSVAFGRPAKVIRRISEEEKKRNILTALHYIEISRSYQKSSES